VSCAGTYANQSFAMVLQMCMTADDQKKQKEMQLAQAALSKDTSGFICVLGVGGVPSRTITTPAITTPAPKTALSAAGALDSATGLGLAASFTALFSVMTVLY
jgi:hypothetical protein